MCGSAYGCTYNSAVFEVKKEVADQTVYLRLATKAGWYEQQHLRLYPNGEIPRCSTQWNSTCLMKNTQ